MNHLFRLRTIYTTDLLVLQNKPLNIRELALLGLVNNYRGELAVVDLTLYDKLIFYDFVVHMSEKVFLFCQEGFDGKSIEFPVRSLTFPHHFELQANTLLEHLETILSKLGI